MKKTINIIVFCLISACCAAQNTFPSTGNVGIGTASPGAKLSFNNLSDSVTPDGITWYNPSPLSYGIYKSAGSWLGPDFLQLVVHFETGIALNPGIAYPKSYVDVQGGGLRVTSGNLGIGTTTPAAKISFNDVSDGSNGPDGITWFNPNPLSYGIYRSAGPWLSPDYQQLVVHFDTGIALNPGSQSGKSYVDIQGGGLRVTSGNVGIGTTDTKGYKLAVNGNIRTQEVRVENTNWPDYVFERSYAIKSLPELEVFINKYKHLPEIPTASEVAKDGFDVGDMNAKLLKKIEELTLMLIHQNKKIEKLETELSAKQ
jgi:hypothetical protein